MNLKLDILRQEVKQFQKNSPRVLKRFLALIELTKFRHKHGCVKESEYERGGFEALILKKACGRKAKMIRGHTAQKIMSIRKFYNWGAEVIQAHLKFDYKIELSRHKIHSYLRKKGLLIKKRYKPRKKHTRVVRVLTPGAHTQTDVKHLPHILGNGLKCYNYNFVDHASKWSYKRAYESYGSFETTDF